MSDERITALEEMAAHQTKIIDDLSEQVTEQWKLIDQMKRALERMGERLTQAESGLGEAPPVTKPPHY